MIVWNTLEYGVSGVGGKFLMSCSINGDGGGGGGGPYHFLLVPRLKI